MYSECEVGSVTNKGRELLYQYREKIGQIAKANGINKVSVFGSVVHGEDNADSDIDLLVEIDDDRSLFDLIRFKQTVEELLGRKVDVITDQAVHWTLKEYILSEAVQL
jgi:hypothetical protein